MFKTLYSECGIFSYSVAIYKSSPNKLIHPFNSRVYANFKEIRNKNVTGVFLTAQACARKMIEQGEGAAWEIVS